VRTRPGSSLSSAAPFNSALAGYCGLPRTSTWPCSVGLPQRSLMIATGHGLSVRYKSGDVGSERRDDACGCESPGCQRASPRRRSRAFSEFSHDPGRKAPRWRPELWLQDPKKAVGGHVLAHAFHTVSQASLRLAALPHWSATPPCYSVMCAAHHGPQRPR
jgi:hypothetical protein